MGAVGSVFKVGGGGRDLSFGLVYWGLTPQQQILKLKQIKQINKAKARFEVKVGESSVIWTT